MDCVGIILKNARLVRQGEELEHYQPGPSAPTSGVEGGARHDTAGQLVPKMS